MSDMPPPAVVQAIENTDRLLRVQQALLECAAEGIYGVDVDGRCTFINEAAAAMLGYSRDELLGSKMHAVIHHHRPDGSAYPAEECPILQAIKRGSSARVAGEVLWRKDGTCFAAEYASAPVVVDGVVEGAVVTMSDVSERKRVEDALRDRTAELEALLSNAPIGFAFFDREHRYVLLNQQLADMNGIPLDEHIGRSIRELLKKNAQLVEPALERVFATGESHQSEITGETPRHPGVTRHWIVGFFPVHHDDGSVKLVGATVVEITDRKNTEALVQASEQRFRSLVQAMPQLVWSTDPNGHCDYLSPQWVEYTGVPEQQHHGIEWQRAVHPDDLARTGRAWADFVAGVAPYDVEYRLRRHDGVYRWFKARAATIRSQDGEIVRVYGTSTDIDDEKRAQAELQSAHDRLAIAQNTARMGSWEFDIIAGKLHWSEAVERMHGMSPGSFDGTFESWVKTVHADDLDMVMAAVRRAIDETGEYETEYRSLRVDGGFYWAAARGIVHRDENGKPLRMVGMCMDITSRKLSDEAMRRSEKLAAAGRLAATMAHEVNNPLEAVTNILYLLQSRDDIAPDAKRLVEQADAELRRVANLTRQTLAFYKGAGAPKRLDLKRIAEELVSVYSREAHKRDVQLINAVGDHFITATDGEMRQVLSNLISNALDATPRGKQIRVASVEEDDHIVLTVEDAGPGVANELAGKIFEPFFTTKQEFGTGLGLWVTKEIVTKWHGSIQTDRSEDLGGARFTMRFPV